MYFMYYSYRIETYEAGRFANLVLSRRMAIVTRGGSENPAFHSELKSGFSQNFIYVIQS